MSIKVVCGCGFFTLLPSEWEGKRVKCKCGRTFIVGEAGALAEPPAVAAAEEPVVPPIADPQRPVTEVPSQPEPAVPLARRIRRCPPKSPLPRADYLPTATRFASAPQVCAGRHVAVAGRGQFVRLDRGVTRSWLVGGRHSGCGTTAGIDTAGGPGVDRRGGSSGRRPAGHAAH